MSIGFKDRFFTVNSKVFQYFKSYNFLFFSSFGAFKKLLILTILIEYRFFKYMNEVVFVLEEK